MELIAKIESQQARFVNAAYVAIMWGACSGDKLLG